MPNSDVLVVCEFAEGQGGAGSGRLIAAASRLADSWSGKLVCLLVGDVDANKAGNLKSSFDEIWVASSDRGTRGSVKDYAAVRYIVSNLDPGAVLFTHTFAGMDLAPRLAADLDVAVAANCLTLDAEDERLYLVRPMYRGKVIARVEAIDRPVVATIQSGESAPAEVAREAVVKTFSLAADESPRVRHIRYISPVKAGVDISKAEIIVAGGRGVGERENFVLIDTLAHTLGGVPACSRPLVDMGWFGPEYQVGMSGNSVKPKLYIACGISGAAEHLHGMKESELIVAINKDPDAPIFKIAHFGVVGDVNDYVPALTQQVNSARNNVCLKGLDLCKPD